MAQGTYAQKYYRASKAGPRNQPSTVRDESGRVYTVTGRRAVLPQTVSEGDVRALYEAMTRGGTITGSPGAPLDQFKALLAAGNPAAVSLAGPHNAPGVQGFVGGAGRPGIGPAGPAPGRLGGLLGGGAGGVFGAAQPRAAAPAAGQWSVESSPLMQALLGAARSMAPEAMNMVREAMVARGPGMVGSTFSQADQARAVQDLLARALSQAPGVFAAETGAAQAERRLSLDEALARAGLDQQAWERAMTERGFRTEEEQRAWERGMTEREFGESTRRWEQEFELRKQELANRWADEAASQGLDRGLMFEEYVGLIDALETGWRDPQDPAGMKPDEARRYVRFGVAAGYITDAEARALLKAIDEWEQSRKWTAR